MRILVTGASGQLGQELQKLLNEYSIHDAIFASHEQLDITDFYATRDYVHKNKIDIIINCAAYTNVDKAETEFLEAQKINCLGPENLANTGCKIIHISTDYVFSGFSKEPYKPTDEPSPCSVYGLTKLNGERAIIENAGVYAIIRTSWLYSQHGKNFVNTILNLAQNNKTIKVVNDQFGSPTYAPDLASYIIDMVIPNLNYSNRGVYHFANTGYCSRYEFAREIIKLSGLQCEVIPVASKEFKTIAKRPKFSALDSTHTIETFGGEIQDWKTSLSKFMQEYKELQI